jgi:hypothetical protein
MDLDEVLGQCFDLLDHAAADPSSRWRNLTLATTGTDLSPQARTVVLRAFDRNLRRLDVHTDTRSAKFAELRQQPNAQLHGWDAECATQLRITGMVKLHVGDAAAHEAWQALKPASRATYHVQPGPGTRLADPDAITQGNKDTALGIFCVVRMQIVQLEWLHLAQGSHRRARFGWMGDRWSSMWLVP